MARFFVLKENIREGRAAVAMITRVFENFWSARINCRISFPDTSGR